MGTRDFATFKTIILPVVLILVIAILLSKYNNAFMRFMVGREVELKTADFRRLETENFYIRYTIIDINDINVTGNAAEYAYDTVTDFFGFRPRGKTMIVVYPDTTSLAHSFGWDKSQKAEGVYWGGTIRIVTPQLWQEELSGTEGQDLLHAGPLVHEFAHLMVDEQTRGNYNRWWTEGIAQYAEKKITGFQFDEPFTSGQSIEVCSLADLNKKFDSDESMLAYWQSLQTIEYIVANYGEASLLIIMGHLGRGDTFRQALTKSLSVEYEAWEQGLYEEMRKKPEQEV